MIEREFPLLSDDPPTIFTTSGSVGIHSGSEDERQLGQLNRDAREKGWRAALDEAFGSTGFNKYVAGEERLQTVEILPLEAGQRILEIGPGYGQMTAAIARRVATVDAIEADRGQAQFCAIRAAQENLANVRVAAAGEDARLPYAGGQFDGVVMNLVFEWCGIRAHGLSHEAAQRRYLDEIARVLKPGGFLFLSTKNRYAIRLLTGGRDEHMAEMRFGSALPRFIGAMLTGFKRPAGRLYSFPRLRAMIERAGFSEISGFWAVPDMRWPTAFIPLEPDAVRRARASAELVLGTSRRTSRLMAMVPARLVRYLTPGLTFLAQRNGRPS